MGDKVVITGINIISPLGLNIAENWNNLLAGKSGIKSISLFDASSLDTQIAGEVSSDFEEYSRSHIKKRLRKQMTRVSQMSYVCAKDAIESSGIDVEEFDKERCAVILGIVHSGNTSVEKGTTLQNFILKGMTNSLPAWISIDYGFKGPAYSVATACSSSAYAISLGYDLIKQNKADLVITGGADSIINPEEIDGFNAIYALSTNNDDPAKASKPFSLDRDGFVIGEGAGMVILESEASAIKRKARIYAEMAGYATTSEAFNIMAPKTDGEGMARSMEIAIEHAGVKKESVGYVNAHGTGTTLNDKFETIAIKSVFNNYAHGIAINSSKSMLGHTIGAAGAVEAAITIKSIYEGMVHPTINLSKPDPELDLDYIPEGARKLDLECALSNSFAFGGHNSTLVFRKYQ